MINQFLKINAKLKTTQNEGSFNKYHSIRFMDFLGQEFRQSTARMVCLRFMMSTASARKTMAGMTCLGIAITWGLLSLGWDDLKAGFSLHCQLEHLCITSPTTLKLFSKSSKVIHHFRGKDMEGQIVGLACSKSHVYKIWLHLPQHRPSNSDILSRHKCSDNYPPRAINFTCKLDIMKQHQLKISNELTFQRRLAG